MGKLVNTVALWCVTFLSTIKFEKSVEEDVILKGARWVSHGNFCLQQ